MSGRSSRLSWVKLSNIPDGANAEDVGLLLRAPRDESATVLKVSWTSGLRKEALLGISGLGPEGERNLTSINPTNVSLVPAPERQMSAIAVSSLIPTVRGETQDTFDPIMRGPPLSMDSAHERVLRHVKTHSNVGSYAPISMDVSAIRPRRHYSESVEMNIGCADPYPTQTSPPTTGICIPRKPQSSSSPSELGIQSRTVIFEGVDETWDEMDFEMALDNEEKGGGAIEEGGIVLKGATVYVTFKEAAVAQRVVAKGNWPLLDRNVKVTLLVREPDPLEELLQTYNPACTVVLRGIPTTTTHRALLTHIAANTHLEEGRDYELEEKNGLALVVLETHCSVEKFMKQINRPKYHLSDSSSVLLQAMRLRAVNSVLLTKVEDRWCDVRKLKLYFGNKQRSGASDVKDVEIKGRGKAVVTFQDTRNLKDVLRDVLEHDHSMLGPDVTVCLYHPVLSEWNTAYTGKSDAVQVQHHPYDYPISDTLYKHLSKNSDVTSTINAQLRNSCAELKLSSKPPAITVHPTTGSEWMPHWYPSCEQVLSNFLVNYREIIIDIPPDVAQAIFQTLMVTIQSGEVTVDHIEGRNQQILVGRKEVVDDLKSKLDKIIRLHHHTSKELALPQTQLVYIDVCIRGALLRLHPEVVFSVNMQNGTLQANGTASTVEAFIRNATRGESVSKEVRLPRIALHLLASYEGRGILQKHLSDYHIGYFFTSEDGSVPKSDLAPLEAVHLVAVTNQQVLAAADRLSAAVAVDTVNTAEEFIRVVQLQAWDDMRRSLQKEYLAYLRPEPSQRKLHLASPAEHMEQVKADVLQFLKAHCYAEEAIPLHKGQAEYLQKYCKEWADLQQEINGRKVKCTVQPIAKGKNMEVLLEGEMSPVKAIAAKVRHVSSNVAVNELHVNAPMAVKHLQSPAGEYQLAGLATTSQAAIQVVAVPFNREANDGNVPSPFASLEAPLHLPICMGKATEGGMTVSIMHGDLTEYHVDVIVNAANENLNHAGGIARELVRKGGDEIQRASTNYIKLAGKVRKGKAVLLKVVGKLPCQAIVHTVGPRWNGGMDNEQQWIQKAVVTSLQEASSYATVAFPALSTGMFRVPAEVSAQGMIDGIVAFARENPRSSVKKVTIMLYQEEHIDPFVAKAAAHLYDVRIKDQRFKKHASRRNAAARNKGDAAVPKPHRSHTALQRAAEIFRSVRVIKGTLTEQKVDVYVSSASPDLNLTSSGLDTGGEQLRLVCGEYIDQYGFIPYWRIATTVAGNLKCKHVVHAVVGDCRQSLEGSKQDMTNMLDRALQECNRLKAETVAIPALGTGVRGFPHKVAADVIIQAVVLYLGKHTNTSIKDVILVSNNEETHRAFQAVQNQMQQEAEVMAQHGGTPIKCLHAQVINDVNLEILCGDIAQIECDGHVLVSTLEDAQRDMSSLIPATDPMLSCSFSSSSPIMEECSLAPQQVRVFRQPQNVKLKCKCVLQVLIPQGLEECQQMVLKLLQRAEAEKLDSIAFPANMCMSAKRGMDQSQVDGAIYGIIAAFIKDKAQHTVKSISLVNPEEKVGMEKTTTSDIHTRTTADKLCIGVFSGSMGNTNRVIDEIHKLIEEKFHFEEIRDEKISKLSKNAIDRLQYQASEAGVSINVKQAPQNVIVIVGEKASVSLMITIVRNELEGAEQAEHFISKVQWQWRDDTGVFQNYPHAMNKIIEDARQRKQEFAWLSTEEGTQLIDFHKMMQHCLAPPFKVTDVRPQDVQKGAIPSWWDPMPEDEDCKVVTLVPNSHEYREVADLFALTMQPGVNVPGMTTPYQEIVRINRIQNRTLHFQYMGRKQAMQGRNLPQLEWKLWHGCKGSVVKQINHGGFDRSFAAGTGNVYGRGVYFARDASGAANDRYSPRDTNNHKHMYLARVLVGEYTVGMRDLIVPPPKDPTNPAILYDSVVDNQEHPRVFCIFQDSQVYPDYHIEFS